MTIQQQRSRKEFKSKVYSLDLAGLKELFERLKADDSTPLGMLMWLSGVYAEKSRNPAQRLTN